MHIAGDLKREKKENQKSFEENIVQNIPNLMKTINLQIQEVQQTYGTSNMRKITSMCTVTKPSEKCYIMKASKLCSKDQNKDASRIFFGNYPRKNISVQHV